MRILHVHATPAWIGGSERSLDLSLRALRELGHHSSVLCERTDGAAGMPVADDVIERRDLFDLEPLSPRASARLRRELLRAVEAAEPDVVHVRIGMRPGLVRSLAARWPTLCSAHLPVCPNGARFRYREGTVCEATVGAACFLSGFRRHGCGHLSTGASVSAPAFARSIWTTKQLLHAFERCRWVVASSSWQAERLAADGVPAARITVVHPPIRLLDRSGSAGPPVVAVAARLVPTKGVDHLLRASALVELAHRVRVIGDGPHRPRLERLAEELGIRERVTFHGGVAPEIADRLLGEAMVVVAPSLWPETFNQVGAQAAVSGIAVAAYDVGGMRDWASRYPHVAFARPGDWRDLARAIERHLTAAGAEAPRPVDDFTAGEHVRKLVRLYESAHQEVAA